MVDPSNTIVPAGNRPFEPPVNRPGPTTNLRSVATISYSNPAPSYITNTGRHFKAQYPTVDLQAGPRNNALDPILDAPATLRTTGSRTTISTPIHFAGLLPASRQGWYHEGALTAPLSQTINGSVSDPIRLQPRSRPVL